MKTSKSLKRLIGMPLSAVGIITLAPLLGVVALLVRVVMAKPVIFAQTLPDFNVRLIYMS
jgi:lipopolysaccharide/colanic/teichoic acid biosynthesis glycosyltransferase